MAIILLKNRDCQENIATQQQYILKYALSNGFTIEATEIDNFSSDSVLEERKWLRGFLRSLKPNDTVLAYDLWSLTPKVDELVKIFECMLRRNISLHLCFRHFIVSNQTPAFDILELLASQRKANLHPEKNFCVGRPKGRMSRSKFDDNRSVIVSLLEKNLPVNKIAQMLDLSRSSLKDYINSRSLKELANIKKTLPTKDEKTARVTSEKSDKECELIAQN